VFNAELSLYEFYFFKEVQVVVYQLNAGIKKEGVTSITIPLLVESVVTRTI
jgi:hypothetical protein